MIHTLAFSALLDSGYFNIEASQFPYSRHFSDYRKLWAPNLSLPLATLLKEGSPERPASISRVDPRSKAITRPRAIRIRIIHAQEVHSKALANYRSLFQTQGAMNEGYHCIPRNEGTTITEGFRKLSGEAKALYHKSAPQTQQSDILAFSIVYFSKQNDTTAPTRIIKIYEELQTEGREGELSKLTRPRICRMLKW